MSIAVGTRVTSRPPPRSVRAQFEHTAPTLVDDGETPILRFAVRAPAPVTRVPGSVSGCVICWLAFPSAPALRSTGSAAVSTALFVGFPAQAQMVAAPGWPQGQEGSRDGSGQAHRQNEQRNLSGTVQKRRWRSTSTGGSTTCAHRFRHGRSRTTGKSTPSTSTRCSATPAVEAQARRDRQGME